MMDEKKTVLWLGSCYRRPGRVAIGSVGGDGAWRVVGNEVRDEERGLSKGGVILFQPDLVASISLQCIEVA